MDPYETYQQYTPWLLSLQMSYCIMSSQSRLMDSYY